MHKRLRILWITWTAITAAVLLALAVGAGLLANSAAGKLAAPELAQTTKIIGQSLANDIGRALSYQIPIDALVGVDDWFGGVMKANPLLSTLALTDAAGRPLAGDGLTPLLSEMLSARRSPQSGLVDGNYISTLAIYGYNGDIAGWLHVGSAAPPVNPSAWLWSLGAAAMLTLLASALLRQLIQRRLAAPLTDCRDASGKLAQGELPALLAGAARDPAARLRNALAERIHAVHKRNAYLLLKIAEVRAAHFDPTVLETLDQLAAPLAGLLRRADREAGAMAAGASRASAAQRAIAAALAAVAVIALSFLSMQYLQNRGNDTRLVLSREQSLQQAWTATLEQDQVALDTKLQTLLANPDFIALLADGDGQALDAELNHQSSAHLMLAVFDSNGHPRQIGTLNDPAAHLDSVTLDELHKDAASIHGIWQNTARAYQSGVARRVTIEGGEELLIVAAQPLDDSLLHLDRRLAADTAVADLRGHPVSETDETLIADWNQHKRQDYIDSAEPASIVVSIPLTAHSGHALGTLVARVFSPAQSSHHGSRLLLALCSIAALLATAGLLFYLFHLFKPIANTTQRLEELADGKTDNDAPPEENSAETQRLYRVVRRLAEKIDALETLRRSRERQGRRQARFIRSQMMQLASRLDEGARQGILEDLERIEHAGQPAAAKEPGDPRLEGIADEFGILALGFQNLVGRVGQQYQELDRLVSELREALRAKTQFIALQQELEIARNMQLSILPREYQPRNGLELHATMIPAKEVGGDFYDFFSIDEHRVALVVADVSGKGVPAAFFMAISRTLLRAMVQFSENPATCVARVNDLLAADNEEMMFVTLFYAILDTRDGSVIYANAGHNLPYLMRADGRIETVPGTHGIALAVAGGFVFQEGHLTLAPGDGLFMYTDGITEASDSSDQLYGEARLVEALRELRDLPVRDIPARIVARIKEYEAGAGQADDITCLVARYKGGP